MAINRDAHGKALKKITAEIKKNKQAVQDSTLKLNAEEKRFQEELTREGNKQQKSVDDQISRGAEKILSNIKKRGVTLKGGN